MSPPSGSDRTALIVVDMQRLFVDLVGDEGPRVLTAVNARVAATVADGGAVFYTRDIQPNHHPAAGDPLYRLHPTLKVVGPVLEKGPGKDGGFSGFVLTDPQGERGNGGLSALAGHLRHQEVTRVSVVGIAADICVSATAIDAARLGYPTVVPLAATAFVHDHPEGDEGAIAHMRGAGVDCR